MNKSNSSLMIIAGSLAVLLTLSVGCGPRYHANSPSYSGGNSDPYYERDDYRYQRSHDLERQRRDNREREALYREQQKHENERRQWENNRVRSAPPAAKPKCPSGTHPSTHRCTDAERNRGCKDYGRPNGQGCSNF